MVWSDSKQGGQPNFQLSCLEPHAVMLGIQDQKAHLHGTFVRMKDQGALALLVFHASWSSDVCLTKVSQKFAVEAAFPNARLIV